MNTEQPSPQTQDGQVNEPKPTTDWQITPAATVVQPTADSTITAPASITSAEPVTETAAVAEPAAPTEPEMINPAPAESEITASAVPAAVHSNTWRSAWRKSYAYLPEYAVSLILLVVLLASLTTLINLGVHHLPPSPDTTSNAYAYSLGSIELVTALAAVVITLPAFILLYMRTKATEAEQPAIRTHRWRKGFLGAFIVVELLTIIGNLSILAFEILSRYVGSDSILSMLSSGQPDDPLWKPILASALCTAFMAFTVFVIGKEYRQREES